MTAQDGNGSTVKSYAGTVQIHLSDSQAVPPQNSTLTNGVGVFTVTLRTEGLQTVQAEDTAHSSVISKFAKVNVTTAFPATFAVVEPHTAVAGTPFTVTVTAEDVFGGTVTAYAGSVQLSSSDASAVLPQPAALTNGVGKFQVTLQTAGTQNVLTANSGIAVSLSNSISVSAAGLSKLFVTAPATVLPSTAFPVKVLAEDTYGNTVSSYSGTVGFTTSDSNAPAPAGGPLPGGSGTFTAILNTSGNQTLTVTDTGNHNLTGSVVVAVDPLAAASPRAWQSSACPRKSLPAHHFNWAWRRLTPPPTFWRVTAATSISAHQTPRPHCPRVKLAKGWDSSQSLWRRQVSRPLPCRISFTPASKAVPRLQWRWVSPRILPSPAFPAPSPLARPSP